MFHFGVSLANSGCLLCAGFRSFQSLQQFVRRGDSERLPTFPEFDNFDEDQDDQQQHPNKGQQQVIQNPVANLTSWMNYWTIFALLRTFEIYVSPQFATLMFFIHVLVLSNQDLGSKLTETLVDAACRPVFQTIETNVAPKGQKVARFFHTSFAQAVRGAHTQFITMSVPNASDELLDELVAHVVQIKKLVGKEKRRREVEELSNGRGTGTGGGGGGGGAAAGDENRPRTAKKKTGMNVGLRKRTGMRQSLGLW
jgi:hypothetical protein